jgi:hypothetical protein
MSVFDESRSFETKNGFKSKTGAGFYSGPDSPVGTPATQGSFYLRTNSEVWKKYGAGDNDWRRLTDVDLIKSAKPTYTGDDLTKIEYYNSLTQVNGNRVITTDLTYTSDLLTSQVDTYYDEDGVTVVFTANYSYTYDGNDFLTNIEVS